MKYNRWLLFLNVFLLQSYLLRFPLGSYPSNLQEVLIVAQAIVFFFSLLPQRKLWYTIRRIPHHWVILSFILLTCISVVIVPIENKIDFFRHAKFLFFALLLSFIFVETLNTNEDRLKGLKIMGWGAAAFGMFSAVYNLWGYNVAYDYRLQGPLDSAVYLSYYLAPFFILFSLLFLENSKNKSNLTVAIVLALLLIATRSMGSIAGSFAVVVLYWFMKGNLKFLKNKKVKIITAIVGLLIIFAIFYTKILPSLQTNNTSLGERDEIWVTSLDLLKEPKNLFFGVGFGQFEHQYIQNVDRVLGHKPLDYHILQPHNLFLLFIFQYGVLGVIFLVYCMALIIKNILFSQKKGDVSILMGFILLYFFIHGMIDTPFFKNDLLIMLILFLEIALITPKYNSRPA